ncbi:multicomponent Na+:H+ antiporter subunit F [Bacillus tianshenii]|jgi:multicomponent Na+:H+ antiporter subunit F|uniref:Multicomponent Na+:H+ antiporter subunit F n=1 Tax=Sutcliffiella tianshenii TaxID=1463404 RepID=A0ABS2P6Q3_9BACI|nr:Na(+)/H(+) antiporter subunit F1 [Bacillus tianshenii]MBM7622388.1 multicomponent Na+:H+ antiporter subunit F [Bacillus tianshenii]MCA1321808.1 Na(+)/H(+) antiporter subunit F1 [Bacillus tianshenii]
MFDTPLEALLTVSLLILSVSTLGLVYRVIKGPSTPDRVMALDSIGINLIAITAIISILLKTDAFLEVILLIGVIAFVGTVAFSKFLQKGDAIEYDRNS